MKRTVDIHNPVIMEQFEILRRCLDNMEEELDIIRLEPITGCLLDHIDHIRTELGRLRKYIGIKDGRQ